MDSATKSVIFVLIGLGVVWAISGGPSRMEKGFFLTPATLNTSSQGYGEIPSWSFLKNSNSSINKTKLSQEELLALEINETKEAAEQIEYDLEKIKEEENKSVYFGQITISRASATQTDINKEYIKLKVNNIEEALQISDWKLRSAITGSEVYLGNAVKLAYTSQNNYEQAIFVSGGENIIVSTGRSPIGFSFQINKCSGYLEQFQDFNPSISKKCPQIEDEDLPFTGPNSFNDACFDYVESISRCETPLNFPLSMQSECRNYLIDKANHNSCIDNYRDDFDFYQQEWRIFLNRSNELWKKEREVIELVDSQSKLVDSYSY